MVKFALAATTIAVSIACCPRACAADAVFYDGVFQRGERAEGRWEVPKLREWLWKHWYQRTAGTAILKWVTMEGDGGTSDYTIAKNAGGSWYLSIPSARLREADVPRRQGRVA